MKQPCIIFHKTRTLSIDDMSLFIIFPYQKHWQWLSTSHAIYLANVNTGWSSVGLWPAGVVWLPDEVLAALAGRSGHAAEEEGDGGQAAVGQQAGQAAAGQRGDRRGKAQAKINTGRSFEVLGSDVVCTRRDSVWGMKFPMCSCNHSQYQGQVVPSDKYEYEMNGAVILHLRHNKPTHLMFHT